MKKYIMIGLLVASTLSYAAEDVKQQPIVPAKTEKKETKNLSPEKIAELKRKHHCTIMHTVATTVLLGLGIIIGWVITKNK